MGASAAVPFKDPAREEMVKHITREKEEVKADLREARKDQLLAAKEHNEALNKLKDERLEQAKSHSEEIRKEAQKVEQARKELTEKILDLSRETTDRLLALDRSHRQSMNNAESFLQNVPRLILADEEAKQLDPLFGDVRRNLSDIRASYVALCEMVTEGTCEADMQAEAKQMSQLCENGRSQRINFITQLDPCLNIDFRLRAAAKVALLKMNNVVIAIGKKLYEMRNKKDSINADDLCELEDRIAEMEDLFTGIPSLQGPSTSERAIIALKEMYSNYQSSLVAPGESGDHTTEKQAQSEEKESSA